MTDRLLRGADRFSRMVTMLLAITIVGCDVVNPGRVLEADLEDAGALQAVVNGIVGGLQTSYDNMGRQSTTMGGDLLATSYTSGVYFHWQGRPKAEDVEAYIELRALPSIADNAIERINRVLGAEATSAAVAADAYMWAGFAYRTAGDHYCNAVVDGGAPQDRAVYHQRAVDRFTNAIQVATTVGRDDWLLASYAGRAHSSMQLGDWQGALSDAGQVDTDFVFELPAHSLGDEQNVIYDNTVRQPHMGARWSWFEAYGVGDDPRASYFVLDQQSADGSLGETLAPTKYTANTDPIPLTKGAEMRLIEAEYAITQNNDWAGGLQIINDLRAAVGQAPWPATNQAEAFEALKFERGIVLWVELRRLGDIWRWGGTSVGDPFIEAFYDLLPVDHSLSSGGLVVAIEDRVNCFPYSNTILDTNENL